MRAAAGGRRFSKGRRPVFTRSTGRNAASRSTSPIGQDAARLRALILERADAVINNLKSGALDRYGLGAAELVAAKPSLVCCNLGAFGAAGPLRDRPGYDPMMQAYSGLMSLLGEDGRPPVRVSVSIVDMAAGMWSVIGILAALQERGRTGKGGIVDASLYETALAWMTIPLAGYLADGKIPERHGSGVDMIVPYQAFAAADGDMMVAAGNDNLFRRLAAALDRPDLAEDARFRSNKDRVVHRAELVPILAAIFRARPVRILGRPPRRRRHPQRPAPYARPGRRRPANPGARHDPAPGGQRTRPRRPAALVRRQPPAFCQGRAGARRRQRCETGLTKSEMIMKTPIVLLAAALTAVGLRRTPE